MVKHQHDRGAEIVVKWYTSEDVDNTLPRSAATLFRVSFSERSPSVFEETEWKRDGDDSAGDRARRKWKDDAQNQMSAG